MLTPENTLIALPVLQALHILHHPLAKPHISFAEVVSAIVFVFLAARVDVHGSSFVSDRSTSGGKPLDKETLTGMER
jgi:hypothetical protein